LDFPGTCTNARTLPLHFFEATAGAKAAEVYEESISSLNILAMRNAASRAAVAVAAVDMSNRRLLSTVADGCENSQPAPPSSGDDSWIMALQMPYGIQSVWTVRKTRATDRRQQFIYSRLTTQTLD
jgi:hypothetical protein